VLTGDVPQIDLPGGARSGLRAAVDILDDIDDIYVAELSSADVVRPWVEALRNVGFAVFAKPKVDEDSDVDSDMLEHIALRRDQGLAAVAVASADGQAFREPLEELGALGITVQVLGFREHASWALASDTLEFVDLEDIPGVFRERLPRISLDSLPEQGAWLQPFRPLSSLLASRE